MISVWQAIVLGVVQGVTEFLPISSSAHLYIVPWLFGWSDPGLRFDVALHLGTFIAILAYFWRDWTAIVFAGFGAKSAMPQKTLWLLALGAAPGVLAGVLFQSAAEGFLRSPPIILLALSLAGAFLYLVDRFASKKKNATELDCKDALFVGAAQALAIVPGISRSGSTITLARILGYGRAEAARLSFLFAAPIILGAAVFSLRHLGLNDLTLEFFAGIAASAISGAMIIHFLLRYVASRSYAVFFWYRLALALVIFIVYLKIS